MKHLYKIIIVFFLFTGISFAELSKWKWFGIEIFGNKIFSRSEVLSFVPLEIGTNYIENSFLWNKWCDEIKTNFNFIYARCSAVRYSDLKAYFVIDVVENGDESRLSFRKNPEKTVPLVNNEILQTYDKLRKRMWYLFEQGIPAIEDSSEGYLDYSDNEMSDNVKSLIKLVPPFRENLLEVIKFDKDSKKRAKAATLLNWAFDTETSIASVYKYLNDPSLLVRNNISRFMLHYYDKISVRDVRKGVIKMLAKQLFWPSHGDRNKAIMGLLEIALKKPQDRQYIKQMASKGIRLLASDSILSNVKDPALQLQKLLGL